MTPEHERGMRSGIIMPRTTDAIDAWPGFGKIWSGFMCEQTCLQNGWAREELIAKKKANKINWGRFCFGSADHCQPGAAAKPASPANRSQRHSESPGLADAGSPHLLAHGCQGGCPRLAVTGACTSRGVTLVAKPNRLRPHRLPVLVPCFHDHLLLSTTDNTNTGSTSTTTTTTTARPRSK